MVSLTHRTRVTHSNNPNREVSSNAWNDEHVVSGLKTVANTRTTLAALSTNDPTYLHEASREGSFVFDGRDLSAKVTADPSQGLYVAPHSDATGASGAWVRKIGSQPYDPRYWGVVEGDSSSNAAGTPGTWVAMTNL